MTLETQLVLLDYHYWARDRILEAVEPLSPQDFRRNLNNSFGSVRDTLVHIVSAEWVWCSRWDGDSPSRHLSEGDFPALQDVCARWAAVEEQVRTFMHELGEQDANRRYDYTVFSGDRTSSVLWQMVQHVVNHASYHRGQVTTMLRQLGAEPPKSQDMITFYRERP